MNNDFIELMLRKNSQSAELAIEDGDDWSLSEELIQIADFKMSFDSIENEGISL